MVAIFTPQIGIAERAQRKAAGVDPFPAQFLYPGVSIALPALYEGRIRVTKPSEFGQVTFELLDGTYAGAGIVATDEIYVETQDIHVAGAWTVGTVTDPSAEMDPLDPPSTIPIQVEDGGQIAVASYATQAPNRTRGHIDKTIEGRISTASLLPNTNLRSRGSSLQGFRQSTDNLRQLIFQGPVSGLFRPGDLITGDTSFAFGFIIAAGPGINQGLGPDSAGFFIVVDMGVPQGSPEFDDTIPESVTTARGSTATLKGGGFGVWPIGNNFRAEGLHDGAQPPTLLGNINQVDGISAVTVGEGGDPTRIQIEGFVGASWQTVPFTGPTRLGDYIRLTNTGNGNDGLYGPVFGFDNGVGIFDVAIVKDRFPNPDNTSTPDQVIVEIFTPLSELVNVVNKHDSEVPSAGDPSADLDLETPADSWQALGVNLGDVIEVRPASPAFTSGSEPFGLFRVMDFPAANRANLFPPFSPSTMGDTGGITVYRRKANL